MKQFNNINLIYALRDPRTDEYWYVGKSTKGLNRPKSHFSKSHNEAVNEWVHDLKNDNLLPIIDVLEECDNWYQLVEKEEFWTKKLYSEKHPLCNSINTENTFYQREKIKSLERELEQQIKALKKQKEYYKNSKLIVDFNIRDLGRLVKKYRKFAKLSRRQMVTISDVGKTSIYDIEHGKKDFRIGTLLKILRVLNIKIKLIMPVKI